MRADAQTGGVFGAEVLVDDDDRKAKAQRARQPRSAPSDRNADMSLDIGQAVQVAHWDEDQTTHVHYRGAAWRARWAGPGQPAPGACVIVAIQGNELRLAPAATP
jgi:membrane protein implicated in regulation of membrane protease activity